MPSCSIRENIAAPATVVWPFLCAVSSWPAWLPTFAAVEPVAGNSFGVGARFHVMQPRLRAATWEITSVAPGRGFIWQSRSTGLAMRASHAVEPLGASRCALALEFEFSGALGWPVGFFAAPLVRRYMATEARTFKQLAEAAHADTPT